MGHRTAAVLVIGNEILSGRTREANAYLAAQMLFASGCRLSEIAVVPDEMERIVTALNRLRREAEAVITSGGIGPTHDDITMQAVASAFGVDLVEHDAVIELMRKHYGDAGLNPGRRRMARVPKGAELIRCQKSPAPGCRIGNVYVLAGVPDIFAQQLQGVLHDFGEQPFSRREVEVALPESIFADELAEVQRRFPYVQIGSYPSRCGSKPHAKICLSGQDGAQLDRVEAAVTAMLEKLQVERP